MTLATDNEIGYTMGATPMEPAGDFYFPHLHTFGPKGPISTRGFSRIRWRSNQTVVLIGPFVFMRRLEMSNDFDGFPIPTPENSFILPEEFWDELHKFDTLSEMLITTAYYRLDGDVQHLTTEQWQEYTGLSRPSVHRGMERARTRGLIDLPDAPRNTTGEVYVVQGRGTSMFKIGMTTKSTESRLAELQCGSPVLLDVVTVIKTDDVALLESLLHMRFASKRKHGEWFDLTDEDIEALKREFNG